MSDDGIASAAHAELILSDTHTLAGCRLAGQRDVG